jgi:hypothetical protein
VRTHVQLDLGPECTAGFYWSGLGLFGYVCIYTYVCICMRVCLCLCVCDTILSLFSLSHTLHYTALHYTITLYSAMVDYPYPNSFLMPLPANCVDVMADAILSDGLVGALDVYYNYSGQAACFDIGTHSHKHTYICLFYFHTLHTLTYVYTHTLSCRRRKPQPFSRHGGVGLPSMYAGKHVSVCACVCVE